MITVPPLIIWGRDDRMGAFEIGMGALNSSDDSRLVLLNTCSHCRPPSIRRNTPRRGSTFYSVPEGFGHTTDCQPGRVEETEDGDRATRHHGQH
jgi:hypothetical protein